MLTRAARVGFGDLWQRLCVVGRGCAVFCVRSIRSEAFCCAALGFVVVEQLPGESTGSEGVLRKFAVGESFCFRVLRSC